MAMDELLSDSPHEPLLSNGVRGGKNVKKTRLFVSITKWVLKTTMWVVFIAWVALFFLVPSEFGTNLYNEWVTATENTLFSETGCVLLLYSGPIIIIAFLAVPYLILSGEEEEETEIREKFQGKKKPRFRLGTFPVLVDGPFGVVSAAEFIGIVLFVVFVIWAIYSYTLVNFEILPSYGTLTPGESRVQMLQMSAYCFGLIALSCAAFLFIPITRGSVLLRLIDIPFEHATKYHVWLGNLIMFLLTMHGACYMIVWIIRGIVVESIIEWKSDGGANFAGIICYGFGLLIWVTTLPPIRERYFELFYYTHQLYILFIIFMALHIGDTYFSKAAGGIFLFMLDRFLRFLQSRKSVNVVSATCFPCGTVKLVVPKPENLKYNALSFIFLRVREVSWLQWHPFSVSSSPLDGKYHLSVLIKTVGGWTTKLRSKVRNAIEDESHVEQTFESDSKITASVEGPYGHESSYYLMYQKLILVAGGSGISPFIAILSDVLHKLKQNKPYLPRSISIVWAVKKSNELSLLSTIDMESICPGFSDKLDIDLQIYVTRELEPSLEEGKTDKPLSSVFSNSNFSSMSVLVGTGNKIWPGIYVIVTTLGFILSLAMLDIFYINPYSITYWWYKGLLFVACMAISIIIFGGLVVIVWNRWERTSSEIVDQDRIDMAQAVNGLHQQSLAPSSTIQYGHRPNLKEIFGLVSEQWGNIDIGVIVCGPSSLQSSVAKEIRSQNIRIKSNSPIFHFNSHSFAL